MKCYDIDDVIFSGRDMKEARKQGAVDALNSVEFRQLLLQAKVTELEKILADLHSHLIYCTGKRKEECIKILYDEYERRLEEAKELKED
jgi:hypothetical protein